jgi:hypothetical protein
LKLLELKLQNQKCTLMNLSKHTEEKKPKKEEG